MSFIGRTVRLNLYCRNHHADSSSCKPLLLIRRQQINPSIILGPSLCRAFSTGTGTGAKGYLDRLFGSKWIKNEEKDVTAANRSTKAPAAVISDKTKEILVSGLFSFVGIGTVSYLHYIVTNGSEYTMLLGSFGASAVLLYCFPQAPLCQPRNCIGGQMIAATVGVTVHKVMLLWDTPIAVAVGAPASVSLTIMFTLAMNMAHPPAGGTALIAVLLPLSTVAGGYGLLIPTAIGSVSLVASAWALNNIFAHRKYPKDTWW